jgi:Icc-related predicted phosphoesterase
MRILAVSDTVDRRLYRPDMAKLVGPVDLLLSCGDLPYTYLEYIVTGLQIPHAFFVHGNHDAPERLTSGLVLKSPGGWKNLDRRSVWLRDDDVLIAGLEGSIRYRPGAHHQYTGWEMRLRAQRLFVQLLFNRVRYGRAVDIFVAHSPPVGIHDDPEGAHQGFPVFRDLIRRFRPTLFLHGHRHHYGREPWHTKYQHTEVVNAHPLRLIKLEDGRIHYERLRYR